MTDELFPELGQQLDAESWDWLQTNHSNIADSVAAAVKRGATPDNVRRFVLRRCGSHRQELAQRCQNAARHLLAMREIA
jgi:hypothetical protein